MFKVKRSLFKYSIISLKEDFIKNPWKGKLKRYSTGDTDQYKNWSPKVISRVNICAKKEHFQYQERMMEELDGDTRLGWAGEPGVQRRVWPKTILFGERMF